MSKELTKNVANNVVNTNSQHLTEKWRNGTLPNGKIFWCQDDEGNVAKLIHIRGRFFEWTISEQDDTEQVKEVLAHVPTYYQFVDLTEKVEQLEEDNKYLKLGIETRDKQIEQLVKQLEIATKALKKINRKYRFTVAQDVVYKALKEMKGLK